MTAEERAVFSLPYQQLNLITQLLPQFYGYFKKEINCERREIRIYIGVFFLSFLKTSGNLPHFYFKNRYFLLKCFRFHSFVFLSSILPNGRGSPVKSFCKPLFSMM